MTSEGLRVVITCSGLGSRLGESTEYTNKSLVRVGNKAVLSHIIDSYPPGTSYVITLGYFGDHVKQYIQIAHPGLDVNFVEVENYQGPGSSLGMSLFCAKGKIPGPFIFNACDTITDGLIPENNSPNTLWVSSEKRNRAHYATVQVSGKTARTILQKGESFADDPIYIGKCYIKDSEIFWKNLENLLKSPTSDLSDCHVINKMLHVDKNEFEVHKADIWYDVGNLDDLKRTRDHLGKNINVLDKHDESIFFMDNSVIKFFANEKILKNRVERGKVLAGCTPTVTAHTTNFMKYGFTDGEILCRNDNLDTKMLKDLLLYAKDSMWSKPVASDNRLTKDLCKKFYVDKTLKRVKQFFDERNDKDGIQNINGKNVKAVKHLLEDAQAYDLLDGHMSLFHGDFILENIIYDNQKFTFIDWRQDFAGQITCGDVYYDLAKLNHNLHFNHDIIRDGGFTYRVNETHDVFVDLLCSHKLIKAKRALHDFCKNHGFSMRKIEILTGIIWINMSPLHDKRLGDFLFHFGKLQLYKSINEFIDS